MKLELFGRHSTYMSHFKTITTFILMSIVLIGGGLFFKLNYSHQLTSKHAGLNGVLSETKPVDYLFIGSSHTRMSYDMKLFEKETQTNSYVVAYNGLSFYYIYPLLKYIVEEADLQIKNFVVESYVVTASTRPTIQDKNLFLSAPYLLKKELLAASEKSALPLSLKEQYELVVSSKNQDLSVNVLTDHFLAKTYYKGTQQNVNSGTISRESFDRLKSPLEGNGTTTHKQQQEALIKILALCTEHKLKVTFVESPVPVNVESDVVYKANKHLLKEKIEKSSYNYIDGAKGYPVEDYRNFLDAGHLSKQGRELFSKQIAKNLLSADHTRSR